jgi:squalene-hopene/tetraprenyl-beta-curcumene cyclase
LDYNPGSASADGQYYFLHTFGKAMHAWGQDTVTDDKGVKHDWRKELIDTLTKAQRDDGSWINPKSPRWFEGNPILVTAYGVLTLEEARK